MARNYHQVLAAIVRPIVEGQVRAWQHAHPNGTIRSRSMVTGIGKRVVHDICSPQTVERIKLALEAGCGASTAVQEVNAQDCGALTAGGERTSPPVYPIEGVEEHMNIELALEAGCDTGGVVRMVDEEAQGLIDQQPRK